MTHNLRLPAIALSLAALGTAGVVFWPSEAEPTRGLTGATAPTAGEIEPVTTAPPSAERAAPDRPDTSRPRAPGRAEALPPRTWRGEVLDLSGTPLTGVPIGFAPGSPASFEELARTDEHGRFSFVASPGQAEICCGRPWATVRAGRLGADFGIDDVRRPLLLVAHPTVGLAGRIESADGTPVAGAVLLPTPVAAELVTVDPADAPHASAEPTTSDAKGCFALDGIPAGVVEIQILVHDRIVRRFPAPARDAADLRIVVPTEPRSDRLQFEGRVIAPGGTPVTDALLRLGQALHVRSDSLGNFVLNAPRAEVPLPNTPWIATHPGLLPTTAERDAEDLTLRMPARARRMQGRLVAADGQPRSNLLVFPWRTQRLHDRLDERVEDLAAERSEPIVVGGRARRSVDRSDLDGRFTLTGLRPGVDYRLRIFDPATGFAWTSKPRLSGDSTVDLILPDPRGVQRFAGTVRTRTGRAVAAARIELLTDLGDPQDGVPPDVRVLGETDRAGHFDLEALPTTDGRIRFSSPQIAEQTIAVDNLPRASDDYQVIVARLCTFTVSTSATADRPAIASLRLFDADGAPLPIHVTLPGDTLPTRLVELETSRHGTRLMASEHAASALLIDLQGEEHRVSIRPRIGTETTIGN